MASIDARVNAAGKVTSYRVQFRIDGKQAGESFTDYEDALWFKRLVEAHKGHELVARRILMHKRQDDKIPTLAQFTAEYLDPASGILTGIEPGTRHGYERIARVSFLPMLGDYPLNAITKDVVGRWVAWQEQQPSSKFKGRPLAAKTVANYHALLSNILRAAVERGHIPTNPAYRTKLTRGTPREPVFLSRAEFEAIYAEIPDHYKPLVAFLVGSQARWSEATALTGADLNTDTTPPTVRINKAWKKNPDGAPVLGPPKTKRGRRTVSIWPELVDLIGSGAPDDFLFRGRQSGKRIWYGMFNTRIWHPAVERANIGKRPNPHDLRHTGASWLIADGAPLPYIQARLGHESIQTTINVYGHLLPDAHTQMADSLSRTLSGVVPLRKELEG